MGHHPFQIKLFNLRAKQVTSLAAEMDCTLVEVSSCHTETMPKRSKVQTYSIKALGCLWEGIDGYQLPKIP